MPNVDKQLEKIGNVLTAMLDKANSDLATSQEVADIWVSTINLIKQIKEELTVKNDTFTVELQNKLDEAIKSLNDNFNNLFSDFNKFKTQLEKDSSVVTSQLTNLIGKTLDEVKAIVNNLPTTDNSAELNNLKLEINELNGKINIGESPDEIRNKLELLQGEERLDKSAIKGLDDELNNLKTLISSKNTGRGAFKTNNATQFYDLSTQTDGSTKVFAVPKSVSSIVIGSDFPTILMENNGFTLNATRTQLTLTTENAPSQGSQLLYQYTSMFNI